jgi:uncharacterized protein
MFTAREDLPACVGCGSCCHYTVELNAGVDDVPEEFVVEHEGVRCMEQRGNGACVALDPISLSCTIYERRPKSCRDFERGKPHCLAAVARRAEASLRSKAKVT